MGCCEREMHAGFVQDLNRNGRTIEQPVHGKFFDAYFMCCCIVISNYIARDSSLPLCKSHSQVRCCRDAQYNTVYRNRTFACKRII